MKTEMNIKFNDDKSITINDVRYIPDFWVEAKASAKSEKRHTGIEEPEEGEDAYRIDCDGVSDKFTYSPTLKCYYCRGEITTDEQLAYDRDRAAQIRFALEKYAAEHNAESIDWPDDNSRKYCIVYNPGWEKLSVDFLWATKYDVVYFDSAETAKNAIDAVGEENVLWLYRDYQPYLNAFKME